MGGETERFYSDFKSCLYGRRDGMFSISTLKTVYMGGGKGHFPGLDVSPDGTLFIPGIY